MADIEEGKGGVQYKTIAGPIGLVVEDGYGYEDAVKKYASIIDANAVGGWELLWIQQIPVLKSTVNISGVLTCAMIGAAFLYILGNVRDGIPGVLALVGAVVGGAVGYNVCRTMAVEFFNMLVFAKRD